MKAWSLLLVSMSFVTLGQSAMACPGAYIELNPTSWLSADGVFGSKGLEHSTEELESMIKKGRRPVLNLADKGVATHRVEFLGSIKDDGGIIQAIYVIKDLKTNAESTVILKSNYMGNGLRAKGTDSPDDQLKPRTGFYSTFEAGCR